MRTSVRCVIAALVCLSVSVQAEEWKVTPRLNLGETYTDNVTLAPSGSAKSDWITQVTPGISIEGSGSRLRLKADYALQNLLYANESSRNNFYHQLNASANAILVEDTLFLDAKGNIQQQATSLLAPISNNNLNSGNVSDVSNYSVSPYLVHKFGSVAVSELRYTHDSVNTKVGGLSDSSGNRVDLKLNSGPAFYDLGWGLSYTHEKVDNNLRPDTDSKVFTGTASYRVFPKLRAIATVGYEKNNYIYSGVDQPKGSFWSAGLNWSPTVRTGLNASFGERYFGKTYDFGLNHRTAHTVWIANYSEGITSMRNNMLNPDIFQGAGNYLNNFVHSGGGALTDQVMQAALLQSMLDVLQAGQPLLVLTNQFYLSKQLMASVAVESGKSHVMLTASHSLREAVETTAFTSLFPGTAVPAESTVKQYGLNGQWDIRVSPRDTVNLGAGVSRNVFLTLSRTDNFRYFKMGMTRKLEKKLSGSVDFRHSLRDSNISQSDYTENAITGKLFWVF